MALAAGAGPAAGVLESGLGAERTHYLAGVLRALPSVLPGEEGIFTEGELKEEGYDSTSRGVDGASGVGSEPGNGRPPEGPEELEDLVKSVQAVLGGVEDDPGGLGEGFVEACLSVLDWSPQVRHRQFQERKGNTSGETCMLTVPPPPPPGDRILMSPIGSFLQPLPLH